MSLISQGWQKFMRDSGLDTCRMHQTTRNSSIRFLLPMIGMLAWPAFSEAQIYQEKTTQEQVKDVGDSFEALMLSHLYGQLDKPVFENDSRDNPFATTPTEKLYKSWLTDEVLKKMAQQRPLKFGDMVEKQLQGNRSNDGRTLLK